VLGTGLPHSRRFLYEVHAGGDDISHSNDLSLNAVSIIGMGTSVWRYKVHR
jgi:hypothetical protein